MNAQFKNVWSHTIWYITVNHRQSPNYGRQPFGLDMENICQLQDKHLTAGPVNYKLMNDAYPKMTAFQTIILFSEGAPLTPAGGSSCSLKNKSGKKPNDTEHSD